MQTPNQTQTTNLYRKEAMDAFVNKDMGSAIAHPQLAHLISLIGFSTIVILCGVFIYTQPIYKTTIVSGWVENDLRTTSVFNKEAGSKVLKVLVEKGESVIQGQLIAKIVRPFASMLSDQQISEKLMLIEKKRIQHILVLKKQLEKASLSVNALKLDLSANEKRLTILKKQEEQNQTLGDTSISVQKSLETLSARGLVAQQEVANNQIRVQNIANKRFDIQLTIEQLNAQNTQIRQSIAQQKLEINRLEESITLANIEADEQVVDFKQNVSTDVFAPVSGIIDNLNLQRGDTLSHNQILAHIRPKATRYIVKLAIPSSIINHLTTDSSIKIQVDGFPFQRFGSLLARITHIDKTLMLPQHLKDKPVGIQSPVYIAHAEVLTNNSIKLLAGVPISASIGMKKLTIFQWMVQPIAKSLFLQFGDIE